MPSDSRRSLILLPLLAALLPVRPDLVNAQTTRPASTPLSALAPKLPAPQTTIQSVLQPETRLTIVAGDGVEPTGAGSGRCRVGEINPALMPRVERVVTLQNDTRQPVTIGQTRGSCGCETILLAKNGMTLPRVTLQPGEQAQLRVAIRTANLHSGELHKMVWAYAPGSVKPLASVDIALAVRAYAEFAPALLDFGRMSGGIDTGRALTASLDAALVPNGALPPLVSTNPDVSVIAEGRAQTTQRNGRAWVEQKYRVTVRAQARGGLLSGSLRFAAPPDSVGTNGKTVSGGTVSSGETHDAGGALKTISVPLMGDVAGGLTFTPKSVYLGSLPSGQGAKRQVAVSGAASKLQNLTLTVSSPWITAAWANENAGSTVRILEVTFKPQTPSGALQAQIVLTGSGGEKLTLPVIADVIAGR